MSAETDIDAACDRVARFYETLSPLTLPALDTIYSAQARFIDPFNDVRGIAAIDAIFRHMFEAAEAPRFHIGRRYANGDAAVLGWRFELGVAGGAVAIDGLSELHFDSDGLVTLHHDYWDAAALYDRLPWIGALTRPLRRRLATPKGKLNAAGGRA